jgi:hypothetical protein
VVQPGVVAERHFAVAIDPVAPDPDAGPDLDLSPEGLGFSNAWKAGIGGFYPIAR